MSVIQDALKRRLRDQREAKPVPPREPVVPASHVPPQAPPVAQQVLEHEMQAAPRPRARPAAERAYQRTTASHAMPPRPSGSIGDAGKWLLGFVMGILTLALCAAILFFVQRERPLAQIAPPPDQAEQKNTLPDTVSAPTPPRPSSTSARPSIRTDVAFAPNGWPILKLDGVMLGSTPRKSSAILNGNMVFLNQRIDGVLLKDVDNESIVLEFEGDQKRLQIGETTD